MIGIDCARVWPYGYRVNGFGIGVGGDIADILSVG